LVRRARYLRLAGRERERRSACYYGVGSLKEQRQRSPLPWFRCLWSNIAFILRRVSYSIIPCNRLQPTFHDSDNRPQTRLHFPCRFNAIKTFHCFRRPAALWMPERPLRRLGRPCPRRARPQPASSARAAQTRRPVSCWSSCAPRRGS
jgi:hypothetical protein